MREEDSDDGLDGQFDDMMISLEDDDEGQQSEYQVSRATINNAYEEFLPLFQEVTKTIRCGKAFNSFKRYLQLAHQEVLAIEMERRGTEGGTSGGGNHVFSLPEGGLRRKDERKRKAGSPQKKKQK